MKQKKFSEHVKDYKDLSARMSEDKSLWIDTGRFPPRNRREIDSEWFGEMYSADCQHGDFIKIVGNNFNEGKVGVSKFTILLFEYFSINNSEHPEYQEIKGKWGYLIDFNAIKR